MSGTSEYMKLYDASSQYKNLTPKFESLEFPGNKYDEKIFLDWVNRISNVVRNHPPHGLAIEEFLDLHLDRCAFRAQVVPDWITSNPGLATAEVTDAVSISRSALSHHSAPLGHQSISLGSEDSSIRACMETAPGPCNLFLNSPQSQDSQLIDPTSHFRAMTPGFARKE